MTSDVRSPDLWHGTAGMAARCARRLSDVLSGGILTLLRWQELARQRRALARMDDHMLKDIGLSRADATREAARPFWDDGGDPWLILR